MLGRCLRITEATSLLLVLRGASHDKVLSSYGTSLTTYLVWQNIPMVTTVVIVRLESGHT